MKLCFRRHGVMKYIEYIQLLVLCVTVLAAAQISHHRIRRTCMLAEQKNMAVQIQESAVQNVEREYIDSFSSGVRILNCITLERKTEYELNQNDYETLLKIVEAEAGGEDENGKLLVANVVLNRVKSELFPDTVTDVVYQHSNGIYQFSPVKDGRLNQIAVSKETQDAVDRALAGEDISRGALYFMARRAVSEEKKSWFDSRLTWLFAYGGHEFFE